MPVWREVSQENAGELRAADAPSLAWSAGKHSVAPMPPRAPAALYRLSVVSSMPLHFR